MDVDPTDRASMEPLVEELKHDKHYQEAVWLCGLQNDAPIIFACVRSKRRWTIARKLQSKFSNTATRPCGAKCYTSWSTGIAQLLSEVSRKGHGGEWR